MKNYFKCIGMMLFLLCCGKPVYAQQNQDTIQIEVHSAQELLDALEDNEETEADAVPEEATGSSVEAQQTLLVYADGKIPTFGAKKEITGYDQITVLQYGTAEQAKQAKMLLQQEPAVQGVEYNNTVEAEAVARLRSVKTQTDMIGMEQFQKNAIASKRDVVVAVIDSGLNPGVIPNERLVAGWEDVISGGENARDGYGHGTYVAQIIAEMSEDAVKILPIKAIDNNGRGSILQTVLAIDKACAYHVDVINISLAVTEPGNSPILERAIDKALAKNIKVVVAAGNSDDSTKDGGNADLYAPANIAGVITVGSVDKNKNHSDFSRVGMSVDLVAPGENYHIAGKNTEKCGTSFAAPVVTAGLAELIGRGVEHPELVLEAVAVDLGENGKDPIYGYGLLNMEETMWYCGWQERKNKLEEKTWIAAIPDQTYTGTNICPKVQVYTDYRQLEEGVDYTVSYRNNQNVGTAEVVINGIGNYEGQQHAAFTIAFPSKCAKMLKAVSKRKRVLDVTLKRQQGATRYELQCASDRHFTKNKMTIRMSSNRIQICGIKDRKECYVRARWMQKSGKKCYYSDWSKTKKIIIG